MFKNNSVLSLNVTNIATCRTAIVKPLSILKIASVLSACIVCYNAAYQAHGLDWNLIATKLLEEKCILFTYSILGWH